MGLLQLGQISINFAPQTEQKLSGSSVLQKYSQTGHSLKV